ncbi:MAG TPA: hypothetical protein VIU64_15385 [Polyangia bacterium]
MAATATAQTPPATTGAAAAPPAPAAAAAGPRRSLIGARCADDAAKLCAGVEAGGGKLARCLRTHEAELSAPCKDALEAGAGRAGRGGPPPAPAAGAAAPGAPGASAPGAAAPMGGPVMHGKKMSEWGPMHGMQKQCAADAARLCKDVQPGHGRVAVCLGEHSAELAPGCKQHIDMVMAHMNEKMDMHADCAADVQKLCSDVPAGQGRVAFCLGEHTNELTPACKKHVDEAKAQWAKRPKGPKGAAAGAAVPKPAPAPGAPAAPPAPPAPPAPKM